MFGGIMEKISNLDKIKDVAVAFLNEDIEKTEYSPLIVIHPIFENGIQSVKKDGKFELVNILEDEESFDEIISRYTKRIKNCTNVYEVYSVIRKSYRLTFLKYIEKFLNLKDFSQLLSHAWVSSENPNQDANVSLSTAVKWFKKSNKKILMSEKEYKYYESLPENLTVYRGVAVGRNPKGLSWTCNKDTAEWFANRFNSSGKKGYIQSMNINKSDVLAYFNSRNEDEVVVNTMNYKIKREV